MQISNSDILIQAFNRMIRYANYHIFVVININSTIRNERESVEKFRDLPTQLSISQLLIILE